MGLLSVVTKKAPSLPSRVVLYAAEKFGKCLGRGTPVLMFDGTIKAVEDIQEGDLLMGPDSEPRRVSGLHHGNGALFRVTPTKGDSYVVNANHILSLKMSNRKGGKFHRIVNMPVYKWLEQSKCFQRDGMGWRAEVDWPYRELPLDPYLLGCWLGDGTATKPEITTPDQEVVESMEQYAASHGVAVKERAVAGKARTLAIAGARTGGIAPNPFMSDLKLIGVWDNKHVPHLFKTAGRNQRLELLAGFLDADGYLIKGVFETTIANARLAEDIAFLARSLGFAAYIRPCEKVCTNSPTKASGVYYRITISGNTHLIPNRVPRRKAHVRTRNKDVTVVGIRVEPIGDGDYFGFEVDGDHLFLLGDFTVTHNTSFAAHAPAPIFLMTQGETGLLSLMEGGRIPAVDHFPEDFKSWSKLLQAVKALRDEEHSFRTIVIDTGNGAEHLCCQHICDDKFDGDWKSYQSYGKGNEQAMKEWSRFLALMDEVRIQRKMSCLILHHARVKTFQDPAGKDWDQWKPEAVDKLWAMTHKWSDVIAFGGFKVAVRDDKAMSESRYLRTEASGAIVAGNRYGMPPEITSPPGAKNLWAAFANALVKAKSSGHTEKPADAASVPAKGEKTALPRKEEKKDEPWEERMNRQIGQAGDVKALRAAFTDMMSQFPQGEVMEDPGHQNLMMVWTDRCITVFEESKNHEVIKTAGSLLEDRKLLFPSDLYESLLNQIDEAMEAAAV